MPVEVEIWRLGDTPEKVQFSSLDSEAMLEDMLVADLSILAPQLMLIGRQVVTGSGKLIDILAMDPDGNLVVVELKRDKTPRDVVAQVLDYASWVQDLSYDEIKAIFADPSVHREIDPVGLAQIYTFRGPLAGHTAFRGIQELKPGHYATVANGNITSHSYWSLSFPEDGNEPSLDEAENATRLRQDVLVKHEDIGRIFPDVV